MLRCEEQEALVSSDELRPVPGYEGLYSVTSDGRVWSHPKAVRRRWNRVRLLPGHWMTPCVTQGTGYYRVTLTLKGKKKYAHVHRLVALAWVLNPDQLPEVNHKNGKKTDNDHQNLEWCTRAHNTKHAYDIGLHLITQKVRDGCRRSRLKTRKFLQTQFHVS